MARRGFRLATLAATALAVAFGATGLQAQTYPAQPLRMLVAFAPGGSADIVARAIGSRLSDALGRPVVVENRPGAGGQLAVRAVLAAPADGYTLLTTGNGTIVVAPHMEKLDYDPVAELVPVAIPGKGVLAVAVGANSPIRSLAELASSSRQVPGGLSYGMPGNGTLSHLAGELLKARTGANLVAIPYQGLGPVLLALISGEVAVAIADLTTLKPQLDDGRVRVLSVMGESRSTALPDVPTVAEQGHSGFAAGPWAGLFVRAGTPLGIVERLNAELVKIIGSAEMRGILLRESLEPTPMSVPEMRSLVGAESKTWAEIIAVAGLRPN